MFDGISVVVFGVMLLLIVVDVVGGKGCYNLCIGLFGFVVGIGVMFSMVVVGYVVDYFGNVVSFFGFVVVGVFVVLLVWFVMFEICVENGDVMVDELVVVLFE